MRTPPLPKVDLLITNTAEVLTCAPSGEDLVGRIPEGALAITGERILAVGPAAELQRQFDASEAQIVDAQGGVVAPGFVDSHTHLVFGGSRVQEYAARLTHTAEDVQAMGIPTGIPATVAATRAESRETLAASAGRRLKRMLRHGTTTVESKSGYGLALDEELKLLEVNRLLDDRHPADVVSTFLGAHAIPAGWERHRYVDEVVAAMIPAVADRGLAEFCDVYCDRGYFEVADARRILETAAEAGLGLKIHTDQYSHLGGAALAAELGVTSADHLNYTSRAEMEQLARAGVVGVLMPAIDFAVAHPHPCDAPAMRQAGMTLAVATDLCPGGWTESMLLVMQLACRMLRFSPSEALYAATVGGARALHRADRGALAPGLLADLQVWDLPTFEDVVYRLGHNPVKIVIKRGRVVVPDNAT